MVGETVACAACGTRMGRLGRTPSHAPYNGEVLCVRCEGQRFQAWAAGVRGRLAEQAAHLERQCAVLEA